MQLSISISFQSVPYNSITSLLYEFESILNFKSYESIPSSTYISCLSEYKKGNLWLVICSTFIAPVSEIKVILYSLYLKVALLSSK